MHRTSVRFLFAAIAFVLILGVTAPMASADTILTYTGNPFNDCTGAYGTNPNCTGSVSIRLDLGTFTFTGAATYTPTPIGVTSFDGYQTICDAGGAITCATGDETTTLTNDEFSFTTNGLGAITAWDVDLNADPLTEGSYIFTTTNTIGIGSTALHGVDAGNYDLNFNPCHGANNCGDRANDPGSWVISSPEPSTLGLLGAGLVAFGFWARKRAVVASN
jgi:hypothetical protein